MKLSALLAQRQLLLRQAHLANLAFAYERLGEYVRRITRARLNGPVVLKRAEPDTGRSWPVLLALRGNQSVIEEHFSDEDIIDLSDVIAYALDATEPEVAFDLSELDFLFRRPVRLALEEAGVAIDGEPGPVTRREHQDDMHSSACDDEEL